mmetsp:Transcript_91200/g.257131  ORF Transcript_91200/g.257131 Transcript_91200/m.257131 type:complete len:412 (-) Transcript_91200:879-2114(-)
MTNVSFPSAPQCRCKLCKLVLARLAICNNSPVGASSTKSSCVSVCRASAYCWGMLKRWELSRVNNSAARIVSPSKSSPERHNSAPSSSLSTICVGKTRGTREEAREAREEFEEAAPETRWLRRCLAGSCCCGDGAPPPVGGFFPEGSGPGVGFAGLPSVAVPPEAPAPTLPPRPPPPPPPPPPSPPPPRPPQPPTAACTVFRASSFRPKPGGAMGKPPKPPARPSAVAVSRRPPLALGALLEETAGASSVAVLEPPTDVLGRGFLGACWFIETPIKRPLSPPFRTSAPKNKIEGSPLSDNIVHCVCTFLFSSYRCLKVNAWTCAPPTADNAALKASTVAARSSRCTHSKSGRPSKCWPRDNCVSPHALSTRYSVMSMSNTKLKANWAKPRHRSCHLAASCCSFFRAVMSST